MKSLRLEKILNISLSANFWIFRYNMYSACKNDEDADTVHAKTR